MRVFVNGSDAFREMLKCIDNSNKRVWVETYIFEPDVVGKRLIDSLTNAKKRGCNVRLLYDAVGSKNLSETFVEELKKSGAEVMSYNSPFLTWPWKLRNFGLTRNHRKIILCDDNVGFIGGMNIGIEYVDKEFGGNGKKYSPFLIKVDF